MAQSTISMNIAVIGSGYVGLTQGIGLAKLGNNVICRDILQEKVESISKGDPGIYEPGMVESLKEVLGKNFEVTLDLEKAVAKPDIVFICVPTPSREDGSMESKYINKAAEEIGNVLKDTDYKLIIVKSTVVPGTTEEVAEIIEKYSGKKIGEGFGICMNPEFLREGKALEDFFNPDRIIIGEFDKKSGDVLAELYRSFNCPVLRTELKTAEMIKYASNAFLATKVAFANEIGNICKKLRIDVYDVMKGVGLDKRIGEKFLAAGVGFGGSCFPKDVLSLISKANKLSSKPIILEAVIKQNEKQRQKIIELTEGELSSLEGKTVSILGLAFKPDTDDIRGAPSLDIIKHLLDKGAKVKTYDPKAMENTRKVYPDLEYCATPVEALKDSDVCLILTEWDEFRKLEDKDFGTMKNKLIIEGRKVLDKDKVKFEGVCW